MAHQLPPKAGVAYQDMLDNIDKVGTVQRIIDYLQGADVEKAKAAKR